MFTDIESYWIIGDVHGCMFTLEKLLSKLPKDASLIFIGDLVDKGNFSKDVMEFVISNNHLAVFGNHEFLMYNYARDAIIREKHAMWSSNEVYGGNNTVKSYQGDIDTLLKHIEYIPKMPKYLEIENYFLTHGFGLPYYQRKESCHKKLYVNRVEEASADWETGWEKYKIINIFGHTPYEDVLFCKNYIGIDTGCVYGNRLSALNLRTHAVIQQRCIEKDIM